jgi:hypothetical protein
MFEVEVRNVAGEPAAVGSAGPYTLVVDRPADGGAGRPQSGSAAAPSDDGRRPYGPPPRSSAVTASQPRRAPATSDTPGKSSPVDVR